MAIDASEETISYIRKEITEKFKRLLDKFIEDHKIAVTNEVYPNDATKEIWPWETEFDEWLALYGGFDATIVDETPATPEPGEVQGT